MKSKMNDWIVCGRAIGAASGWDQSDIFSLMLYDFVPGAGYSGPRGDILIRLENGTIEAFDDEGNVIKSADLIEAIKGAPVARTDE